MKGKTWVNVLLKIAKGVVSGAVFTLAAMLVLSAIVVLRGISENAIQIINQVIKVLGILLGVYVAVGRGGERGLLTGAVVGILYILMGYGMYSIIDGSDASASVMAIEEAAGALVGGASGAVLANMKPKR